MNSRIAPEAGPDANSVMAPEAADHYPEIDMPLDKGIEPFVLALRSGGIETFESCEGGDGHAFLEPTVRFCGDSSEGYRAFAVAVKHGLPVYSLRRYYSVSGSELEGPWWEMTFRTTAR